MPEIREQAYDVARAVVRALHGETRRRPTDAYGLTLTTEPPRGRGLQRGARPAAPAAGRRRGRAWRPRSPLDPDFAQAQAALALLGHEWGATGSWRSALARGPRRCRRAPPRRPRGQLPRRRHHPAPLRRGHRRRRPAAPHPAVPARRPRGQRRRADGRVRRPHLRAPDRRPRRGTRPHLRRRLVVRRPARLRAPGPGALERGGGPRVVRPLRGARLGARRRTPAPTSSTRPASTPPGSRWLDEWIRTQGPQANHRSHFSWHAALHELMQGDVEAVRRRYERELAPPLVTGSRALVDSGALLWRCHVTDTWTGDLPSEAVCGSAPDGWLISPPTPFAALHAALSLAAEGDEVGLAALRTTSLAHADPVVPRRGRAGVPGAPGRGRGRVRRRGTTARGRCSPAPASSAAARPSARCSRTRWSSPSPGPGTATAPRRCSTAGSTAAPHRSTLRRRDVIRSGRRSSQNV